MLPQSHLEEDLAAGNKFFQRRFFRPLRCDASIYLDADASRPLIGVPSSHQGGPEGGAVFPDGLGKLTPAAAARLEGHQLCAHAAGFCDASFHDWTIPFALADVTQNVEFRRMSGTLHMPTLLKKTKLWDMVRDVPVHPVSIVCAQGFPCAARGVPSELAELFPLRKLTAALLTAGANNEMAEQVAQTRQKRRRHNSSSQYVDVVGTHEPEQLTADQLAALIGNSFNWAQLGAWVCHAYSSWTN